MSDSADVGKIGWETDEIDMGGYSDYVMKMPATGDNVLVEPRGLAGGSFCVVEDPGGSIAGLYQPKVD